MAKLEVQIPKLRNSEFSEEWGKFSLGDVCLKIQDGNYGGDYPRADEFVEDGIPFLTSKALGNDGIIDMRKVDYLPSEKHIQLKKAHLKLNDVLFTNRGANVGVIGYVDERISNGNIGPQLTLLRANCKLILPIFLKYILQTVEVRSQIASQDSGSAMNFFGIKATSKFKFNLPHIFEQKKIASFLTAVDDKIQQLQHKKELLEQYKKGVMQKIFNQEVSFKDDDGKEFPEWEEKNIESHINLITGIALKGDEISEDSIGTPILRGINITEGYIRHSNDIDRYYHGNTEKYKKYIVDKGDLVLGMDGSKVGKNSAIVDELNKGSLLIQRVARIRTKPTLNTKYLFQHIHSIRFHQYVDTVNTSSGIPHISSKQINEFEIPFPSIEEQNKIANFLNAIDKKIELVNTQLEKTHSLKKGLLQQMFV